MGKQKHSNDANYYRNEMRFYVWVAFGIARIGQTFCGLMGDEDLVVLEGELLSTVGNVAFSMGWLQLHRDDKIRKF